MKISAMAAMAIAAAMTAQAGQVSETVTVYLENVGMVPFADLCRAKIIATQMFATAGVKVQFHVGEPPAAPSRYDRTLIIRMAERTPEDSLPGALAFSTPYEGVHIIVFYDRIARVAPKDRTAAVLAHVLVHEVTHTLQGLCRHSESGVMKAHWDPQDYPQMDRKPFPFTAEDVELIQAGLKARAAGPAPMLIAAK